MKVKRKESSNTGDALDFSIELFSYVICIRVLNGQKDTSGIEGHLWH